MTRRRLFLGLMVITTAVLISLILTDWSSVLRGPAPDTSVWHWNYRPRPINRWWAALSAALFIYGIAIWWLKQTVNKRWITATAVTGLAIGSFLLQLGLIYADRSNPFMELVDRTLAVQTNGYYWTAAQMDDINAVLRQYPADMAAFESDHTRTHPPGLVLLNWLTMAGLERMPRLSHRIASAVRPLRCTDLWLYGQPDHIAAALGVWALLPLILAATAVFPTYLLARQLATKTTAVLSTSLMAALPALLIFAPLADQIYPSLTLLIVLAFHQGLSRQRSAWFFLSGILLSLSSFLTLGNAVLLLLISIYAALYIWQTSAAKNKLGNWLIWGATFALGAASIWLLYWLGWGVTPWQIAQAGMAEHYSLVTSKRSYLDWSFYNLVDLALFVGWPIFIGFIAQGLAIIRKNFSSPFTPAAALAASTLFLVIFLNFSGSTRGEVGRIWLFMMPLIVVVGTAFWAEWQPHLSVSGVILGLQLAMALSIGLNWGTVGATIVVAERPSPPASSPTMTPLTVQFGSNITLTGYNLETAATQLALTLQWRSAGPTSRPYTVYNHLLDSEGALITQQDNWPVAGQWPSTCWQAGETVIDQYNLSLPDGLTPGIYTLKTGLYDNRDGSRLTTPDGKESVSFTVEIPSQ